jgi:serine/threonine-protein kinase
MTGELIAGRYRLGDRLGVGGMSTVQLAFDERLEREVAVKLLAEHLAEDPQFISRFQREAQAAARLIHPNIVQVYDSGFDDQSSRHFIVMEYVRGQSCAEILRERGYLDVTEAVSIIEQACQGLDYAHRHGVIHRDVKPGNLLVSEDNAVKLADFGIAKAAEQSSITQVGSVLGTAAYLAPEQARGEEAGPAADIYSLGVVAYQLLAARLPYEAASLNELALKQQQEVPPRVDELNGEVQPPLGYAIARALHPDPGTRYPDALAMAHALKDGALGIGSTEDSWAEGATSATSILPDEDATAATTAMPSRRGAHPSTASSPAATPRQPRQRSGAPPARREPEPVAAPRRSGGGRVLRTLMILLILGLIVAGGAIVAADEFSGSPQLRRVIYDDAQQAIEEIRQLVEDNTR